MRPTRPGMKKAVGSQNAITNVLFSPLRRRAPRSRKWCTLMSTWSTRRRTMKLRYTPFELESPRVYSAIGS